MENLQHRTRINNTTNVLALNGEEKWLTQHRSRTGLLYDETPLVQIHKPQTHSKKIFF